MSSLKSLLILSVLTFSLELKAQNVSVDNKVETLIDKTMKQTLIDQSIEINSSDQNLLNSQSPKLDFMKNSGLEKSDNGFYMREYKENYAISGEPDTKIQFSFKLALIQDVDLFLGFTQVLFWDLEKESKPFNDQNFNPDLFYDFNIGNNFFKTLRLGYEHGSNGKAGNESRSYDSFFATLIGFEELNYGIPKLHLKFRNFHRLDDTNADINKFYGPIVVKFIFERLGKRIFKSEELFLEFYSGDSFKSIVDRGSIRLSLRFKIFKTKTTPKIFFQYFNGFGEDLANYNRKTETYRIGFSIGG